MKDQQRKDLERAEKIFPKTIDMSIKKPEAVPITTTEMVLLEQKRFDLCFGEGSKLGVQELIDWLTLIQSDKVHHVFVDILNCDGDDLDVSIKPIEERTTTETQEEAQARVDNQYQSKINSLKAMMLKGKTDIKYATEELKRYTDITEENEES